MPRDARTDGGNNFEYPHAFWYSSRGTTASKTTFRPKGEGMADHTPAAWAGLRWFRYSTQASKVIRAAQRAMKDADVRRDIWFFLLPMDRMQS